MLGAERSQRCEGHELMAIEFDDALRQRLTQSLASFERRPIDDAAMRLAAVALVIVRGVTANEAALLLTKRPANLRRHASQFALPGGRLDDGETVIEAALREVSEELGLSLDPGAVLGQLDDYPTRSGFRITPIVAWADDISAMTPDPTEVAKVFRIPLADLESPAIPHLETTAEGAEPVLSAHLATLGHRVYAPTAALLYQFREVCLRGLPTRVAHFDQPKFAWT